MTMIALAMAGCTSSEQQALDGPGVVISWPALDELKDPSGAWFKVSRPAQNGNWAGVKRALTETTEFSDLVDAFDKAPIPGKFKTPERETQKNDVVKHLKALIEGAKSGADNKTLEASLKAAQKALTDLTYVPGPEKK